ncbi:MAG: VWA domain-containing protein [Actinomycetia bacterium]|nr:VWA domain-containing protein [Actinomycetes bacterium]
MRARSWTLLSAILLPVVLAGSAIAQETPDTTIEETTILEDPILYDVDQAPPAGAVVSSVVSEDGVLTIEVSIPPEVAGQRLEPDAVGVIVDGHYVVADVARPPGDQLAVILAVDVSGSTAGAVLDQAIAAAVEFIGSVPEGTLVGVLSFAGEPQVLLELSPDKEAAAAAVSGLVGDGPTALFDGVGAAASMLSATDASSRVVVVFSDGGDTNSVSSLAEATAVAESVDAVVEVVSLQSSDADPATLAAIARKGEVRPVADPSSLSAAFTEIGDRLGNSFIVRFDEPVGGFHVVVRGDSGLRHTRVEPEVESGPIGLPRADGATNEAVPQLTSRPSIEPVVAQQPVTPFGDRSLPFGLGAIAGGVFLSAIVIAWPHKNRKRPPRPSLGRRGRPAPRNIAKRFADIAESGLDRSGRTNAVASMLEQSGSSLRVGEWIVSVMGFSLGMMSVVTLLAGPVLGLVTAAMVPLFARTHLQMRVTKTRSAFADQLGSTLQLMASNLRVGHGMLQSIDAVSRESEEPTAHEFKRVTGEVRLGRDVSEALRAMAARLDNDDFRWVVQAIEIHREVGGDLGEVLDNVGATIRDRQRLKGQIHALSADGRISAGVMMALPFCVSGLMLFTTPDYLAELTGRTGGQLLLVFGAGLMIVGAAWLKSIIKLDF